MPRTLPVSYAFTVTLRTTEGIRHHPGGVSRQPCAAAGGRSHPGRV